MYKFKNGEEVRVVDMTKRIKELSEIRTSLRKSEEEDRNGNTR